MRPQNNLQDHMRRRTPHNNSNKKLLLGAALPTHKPHPHPCSYFINPRFSGGRVADVSMRNTSKKVWSRNFELHFLPKFKGSKFGHLTAVISKLFYSRKNSGGVFSLKHLPLAKMKKQLSKRIWSNYQIYGINDLYFFVV
jgi:hypothetical protein